jgi:hypothetical protein
VACRDGAFEIIAGHLKPTNRIRSTVRWPVSSFSLHQRIDTNGRNGFENKTGQAFDIYLRRYKREREKRARLPLLLHR